MRVDKNNKWKTGSNITKRWKLICLHRNLIDVYRIHTHHVHFYRNGYFTIQLSNQKLSKCYYMYTFNIKEICTMSLLPIT